MYFGRVYLPTLIKYLLREILEAEEGLEVSAEVDRERRIEVTGGKNECEKGRKTPPRGYFHDTIKMIDRKLEKNARMTEKKQVLEDKVINHHMVERIKTIKRDSRSK